MIMARKEKKQENETRWMEVKAMEERKATIEERKATIEERKVAIEEEKLRIMSEEARNKTLEQEQKIMFMYSSCLDDDQKSICECNACANFNSLNGHICGWDLWWCHGKFVLKFMVSWSFCFYLIHGWLVVWTLLW